MLAVDRTALPHDLRVVRLSGVDEVIEAIRRSAIGTPAVGGAGALAVALSARAHTRADGRLDEIAVHIDARRIANACPSAAGLAPAVRRVLGRLGGGAGAVLAEALRVLADDDWRDGAAAERAAELVERLCGRRPLRLLTQRDPGGTALRTIRVLHGRGRVEEVLFGRLRPLPPDARLVARELAEVGIPHLMLLDSAGPAALAAGTVDCVLVGADRVGANGDVVNRIGTRSLALAASRSGVPFVVVASGSTVDDAVPGDAPVAAGSPAFDVTRSALITAVVTDSGLHRRVATVVEEAS